MTKASFDTIGGLLIAFVAGNLAQHDYSVADWWRFALHVILLLREFGCSATDIAICRKNKAMTSAALRS